MQWGKSQGQRNGVGREWAQHEASQLETEARTTKRSPKVRQWTTTTTPWPVRSLHVSASWGALQTDSPTWACFPGQLIQCCLIPKWSLSGTGGWHKPSQGHPVAMDKGLFTWPMFVKLPSNISFLQNEWHRVAGKPAFPVTVLWISSSLRPPWVASSSLWMCKRNLVLSLKGQIKSKELYLQILECPCKQEGFPFIISILWQREGETNFRVRVGISRLPLHWGLCCLISMPVFWKKQ